MKLLKVPKKKNDNEFSDPEVLVQVNEWVSTSVILHVVHDNLELHAVLRRDLTSLTPEISGALGAIRLAVLKAAALMELLYPVKYAMFSAETDLMKMMSSDPYAFSSC